MPKVSVIIPVYNVEKYLRRSMDSLINQTMKDLEFICIDDCSTDNSLSILKEYEAKDSRFKIITSDVNCGAAIAKNKGLKIAKGEYLGFIDPDDKIDLNYYEKLYKKAKEEDFDIVKCSLKTIELNGNELTSTLNDRIRKEGKYRFSYEWTTAIYRSSVIFENNITFEEGLIKGEDILFLNNIIFKVTRIGFVDNIYYYYYRRANSLDDKKVSIDNIKSGVKAMSMVLDRLNTNNLYFENKKDYIKLYAWCLFIIIGSNLYRCKNKQSFTIIAQNLIDCYHKCKDIDELKKAFIFQNIIELIDTKDTNGLIKYFNKYRNYKDFLSQTTILEKIFSIKNDTKNHKVITILGVKLKLRRRNKSA